MPNEFVIELAGFEYKLSPPVLVPESVFLDALHNARIKPAPSEEERKAKRDRERQEQEKLSRIYRQKRFETAVRIPDTEWEDPVCCPFDRGYNDGFFGSVAEYLEWEEDEELPEDDQPTFLWATKPHKLEIDAEQLIERAFENMYEGAIERVKGTEKLTQAIDRFLQANEHIVSYEIDYSKVIMLDRVNFWKPRNLEQSND